MKCPIHGEIQGSEPCPRCAVDTLFEIVQAYQEREDRARVVEPWIGHRNDVLFRCNSLLGIVMGLDGKPFVPPCNCGLHQAKGKVYEPMD